MLVYGFFISATLTVAFVDLNGLMNHSWDFYSGSRPPFEISSNKLFWMAYLHQLVSTHLSALVTINYDLLIVSYMLQICAQIEILEWNVMKISMYQSELQYCAVVSCIKLHVKIARYFSVFFIIPLFIENCKQKKKMQKWHSLFRLVEQTQNFFNSTASLQLFLTTPTLALNFYAFMTTNNENPNHYLFFLYVIYELLELLFYCYFGNEITLRVRLLTEKKTKFYSKNSLFKCFFNFFLIEKYSRVLNWVSLFTNQNGWIWAKIPSLLW